MTQPFHGVDSRAEASRSNTLRSGAARLRLAWIAGIAICAALSSHTAAALDRASPRPACFGAAARDPERACVNPRLRLSVVPAPNDAQLEPSAPCSRVTRVPDVCAFGVPVARSNETVALVGDSHAVHWRAALDVVARRRGWYALTLYRSSCPFTAATSKIAEPERSQCRRWSGQVVRWFKRNPQVHTVFVSQHSEGGVIAPGRPQFPARVQGYADIWKALPGSVDRIVVIRDPPYIGTTTLSCVRRAMARRREAGVQCALARSTALKRDPAIDAVAQLKSPRYQAIDLTDFMCDTQLCYPVVGGALVKKDRGHLTRVFAATLAPYLSRALERLTPAGG
jgi:SGNH domain (fused to AT3 domains)